MIEEFLNWYVSLFFDPDNKVVIAAFVATLAVLTFLLNFIGRPFGKWLSSKLGRLSIDIGFSQRFITGGPNIQFLPPLLTATVTNRSKNSIFINKPFLEISEKIMGNTRFSSPRPGENFPKKLESGEQYKDEANTYDLVAKLFDNPDYFRIKIRYGVTSTTGKTYFSKKIKVQEIIDQLEVAGNANK